jgi:hypothetical protein
MKHQVSPITTVAECVEGVRIWYTLGILHLLPERISKNRLTVRRGGPLPPTCMIRGLWHSPFLDVYPLPLMAKCVRNSLLNPTQAEPAGQLQLQRTRTH